METRSFRLVCHYCARKFPINTVLNPKDTGCCNYPDIHVHNTSVNSMCGLCAEPDSNGFIMKIHVRLTDGKASCGRSVFEFVVGEAWAPREQLNTPRGRAQGMPAFNHSMTITCPTCLRIDNKLEQSKP